MAEAPSFTAWKGEQRQGVFLATTALSEFWDKEQEIIFLGPWCLRDDRRHDWENLSYRVMTSPWEDRKRFYEVTQYLDEYAERILEQLTAYLNAVHGVSYSKRYWRIVVGPWLLHYLHTVYDRYVCLTKAFSAYPELKTVVLDPCSFRTPTNTIESQAWESDDPYNLQLFSHILSGMGYKFPTKTLDSEEWAENWYRPKRRPLVKLVKCLVNKILSHAGQANRLVSGNTGHAMLCHTGLPWYTVWTLAWRSEFMAIPIEDTEWPFPMPAPVLDERRQGLAELNGSGQFERIFVRSLPYNFPPLYLEAFESARAAVTKRLKAIPNVILSALGWYFEEPFKFWAAEASERGSRLLPVQHGGGYGCYRYSASELHEKRLGDTFMVWGWADKGSDHCQNLPSPILSSLAHSKHGNDRCRESRLVLFVSTGYYRYLLRFHSCPVGILGEHYIKWQGRFLEALSPWVRQAVRFRPFHQEWGHSARARILSRFPDVSLDDGKPFHEALQNYRLVVVDYLATCLLETMQYGVPTVLYWNPQYSEVREEAVPYFEHLRSVGILWDSPESAAAKVAEIYDDPWKWWGSEAVQQARQTFVDRYALAGKDWLKDWTVALKEQCSMAVR